MHKTKLNLYQYNRVYGLVLACGFVSDTVASNRFQTVRRAVLCAGPIKASALIKEKPRHHRGFSFTQGKGFEPLWDCSQTVFKTASL